MIIIIVRVFEKMKFSSVIVSVLFFSVTVAYSNNPGSTTFKESGTEYKNVVHENSQHRPDFQTVRAPLGASNAYSKTQGINNIKTQLSPNDYNHHIGPESYNPTYPASQHVPHSQIRNYPDVNLHSQAARLQHLISNPKIKALYTASKPTKRYTIIHSNGTVEHTDELHSIAARHPNYVLVKADDILSQNSKFNANNGNPKYLSQIPVQTKKYPQSVKKSIEATNQNIDKTRIGQNSPHSMTKFGGALLNPRYDYQRIQNPEIQKLKTSNQLPIERSASTFPHSTPFSNLPDQRKSIAHHESIDNSPSIVKSFNKAVITDVPSISVPQTKRSNVPLRHEYEVNSNNFVEKVAISNPSPVYEPLRQAIETIKSKSSSAQQVQSDSKIKVENSFMDKPLREDAVAINPLPRYPSESPQKTAISDKHYVSAAAIEPAVKVVNTPTLTLPKPQPIVSLENKDVIFNPSIIKSVEEAIIASNLNIPSLNKVSNHSIENQTSTISTKPFSALPVPTKISLYETVPVILPQVLSQSTQKEVETPTTDITIQEANKPSITKVIEDKSTETNKTTSLRNVLGLNNNQFLESSKNALNKTDGTVQSNTTSLYSTETDTLTKQQVTGSNVETVDHTSSVANDSSKTSSNIVPVTWFNFSEENLWDAIKNNTHNVYFFFMPSHPKVTKEIKTIIFPNGTTIEEIKEIVSDTDQDEEPKMKTRTRIL